MVKEHTKDLLKFLKTFLEQKDLELWLRKFVQDRK